MNNKLLTRLVWTVLLTAMAPVAGGCAKKCGAGFVLDGDVCRKIDAPTETEQAGGAAR